MEIIHIIDDADELGDGGCRKRGNMLGEGSYGAVFVATSSSSSTYPAKMAVKSAEISWAKTLHLERDIFATISDCSSVVQCFGSEITSKIDGTGVYNLLLEFCSGGTLADKIQGTRFGLPELEARRYTRSIVEGLVAIHKAKYVHCDLKPENILLSGTNKEELQAKICDFGLAKGVNDDRQRRRTDRTWQGTPHYLAPEAVNDCMQETPTDIWSLGIIVLEMLTGRPAWDLEEGSGKETERVIRQIQKPGNVPKLPPNLSPEAKNFLQSCLKRMPKNRASAKWLLQHPFISGVKVGPRSRPQDTMDSTRSCIQPAHLNPGHNTKVLIDLD